MSQFAQFNGKIGPANLLSLVRNTAPFLFERKAQSYCSQVSSASQRLMTMRNSPFGWLDILRAAERLECSDNPNTEQREDYFALCLACHHATVATFIPTDVDSKIRGHLWLQREDPQALRHMFDFVLDAMKWDISLISTRATELSGVGPVSGHNGEMLGVMAGALGGFLKTGDSEYAERATDAIHAELEREVHEFRHVLELPGHELDVLRLSSSLTHNVGDLDQGISFWTQADRYKVYRERFHRLAHENTQPYGGTFQIAAQFYKRVMASEGHRHYPLREVRALRSSADFLLPLGPFFDNWGMNIARHPGLSNENRSEVLAALLSGCKKIQNQVGYYRAISGMADVLDGKLDEFIKRMPAALRQESKSPEIRRHIALKQISFESGMRKQAQKIMAVS